MKYINTYGDIPVTLEIYKGDKSFIHYDDFCGDYEGMEVDTVEEALEDIRGNIENYCSSLSSINHIISDSFNNKQYYVGCFAEKYDIDYSEAIENHYDIKIKLIDIDFSKLNIEIEEE